MSLWDDTAQTGSENWVSRGRVTCSASTGRTAVKFNAPATWLLFSTIPEKYRDRIPLAAQIPMLLDDADLGFI